MPLISLPKGANAVIASPLHTAIRLELHWTAPSTSDELDLFLLLLDSKGQVADNADIVFYSQPESAAAAVKYVGRKDASSRHAHLAEITLGRLPDNVHSLAITAALDSEGSQPGTLSSIELTAVSDIGTLFTIPCEGLFSESVAVIAEIYRRNGDWKVRSVSQGWNGGLPDLLTHYGAIIDDEPGTSLSGRQGLGAATSSPAPDTADRAKLSMLQDLDQRIRERDAVLADFESRIVETREINLLQDLGIYDFSHPLEDALQYKDRLTELRAREVRQGALRN